MSLYGDILQANFFDLKNSINRPISGNLEPLKDLESIFLDHITKCVYSVWVAVLKRGFWAFKVAWLRTTTRNLPDELPWGIVLCSPLGCDLGAQEQYDSTTRRA